MSRWLVLAMICIVASIHPVVAQSTQRSAQVYVVGEDLAFQRYNTKAELLLPVGAVAPFGIGDRIRTGNNGRAFITLTDENRILLLPKSEYEIADFSVDAQGQMIFHAGLQGIAIHNLHASATNLTYQLSAATFEIEEADNVFAVWAVLEGLQAVTTSTGVITVRIGEDVHIVNADMGFAVPYSSEPITLSSPLHASQIVARTAGCNGIVNTNGSSGLRLRAGAALDYGVVDILTDGQNVPITGATTNGLWYRIPFQTGFGWIYSNMIVASCEALRPFPDLVGEEPERIRIITTDELEFVEPFYGTAVTNPIFFR